MLDAFYRLTIGGRCEQLWQKAIEEARDKRFAATNREYLKQVAKVQAIPLAERKRLTDDQLSDIEDVELALREDQHIADNDPRDPAHIQTVTAPRPWRLRKPIIERMAREESERCDRRITPRTVKSCWDEYRSFCAKNRKSQ
jgi:hypothetical protein